MTSSNERDDSRGRDRSGVRELMSEIRERLPVSDRAELAVDLVGHLAAVMDRRAVARLMAELHDEASSGVGSDGRGVLREGDEPLV
jgi:hypothetical protein